MPATIAHRAPKARAGRLAAALLILLAAFPSAAAAAEDIADGRYEEPVERYGHFAPGRPHEYARLEVCTASGSILDFALPENEVFEDVAPRLVRLEHGGPDLLLAIVSNRLFGSSLALLGIEKGRFGIVARSAPIGTPKRWLNPVTVADLDGDGRAEIAAVITPHVGGILKIYRRDKGELREVASLDGFSNHIYGTSELGLAVLVPGEPPRMLIPDAARTSLRIVEFRDGALRETGRCRLAAPVVGPLRRTGEGEYEAALGEARQRVRLEACPAPPGAAGRNG